MAHENINERRNFVDKLISQGLNMGIIAAVASEKFRCHKAAVFSDIDRFKIRQTKLSTLRKSIIERDMFACQYCGRTDMKLIMEHILPAFHGGTLDSFNLVAACISCNACKERQVWIPKNFDLICTSIEHYNLILRLAVKDFR